MGYGTVSKWAVISIHAPLTGSDPPTEILGSFRGNFNPRSPYGERLSRTVFWRQYQRISIHAPLTGSDFGKTGVFFDAVRFQSTLPLRGATGVLGFLDISSVYFNPRSPYGERLSGFAYPVCHETISIHAPLTGSDRATES